jgi:hypothetical protein
VENARGMRHDVGMPSPALPALDPCAGDAATCRRRRACARRGGARDPTAELVLGYAVGLMPILLTLGLVKG